MIPLQYIYLVGVLISLIPLGLIYYLRPSLRHGILLAGIIYMPFTLLAEYFLYTSDWWHPLTITDTRIGIEDVLITVSNCGFAYALYPFFFKKQKVIETTIRAKTSFIILSINLLLIAFLFWGLHWSSFLATEACSIGTIILLVARKPKILPPSLFTGGVLLLSYIPIYWILIWFSPEFIEKTWMLKNLSGILIFQIPVEDLIFYFLAGVFVPTVFFYSSSKKASHQ